MGRVAVGLCRTVELDILSYEQINQDKAPFQNGKEGFDLR